MYPIISQNHFTRSLLIKMSAARPTGGHTNIPKVADSPGPSQETNRLRHKRRVLRELRRLGVSEYGLVKLAIRYLPNVIHPDERIGGIVYGRCKGGSAALVATDRRVMFVNKKLMWVDKDEVTYDVVSGVDHTQAGLGSTITLHTRVKDYQVGTLNQKCARNFVEFIEARCLEHQQNEIRPDIRQD